jgi:uncharacterized membrane protein
MINSFGWAGARNYLVSLCVFLAIDMVWLLLIAKSFYAKYLGYLMAPKANLPAALVFYCLYVVGLLYFVINPALAKGTWTAALFPGLLFGLIAYATYDLTNLATIRDWPLLITAVDLVWGSAVSGATALASWFLIRLF